MVKKKDKAKNLSKMESKDGEGNGQLREACINSIKKEGSFQMRGVLAFVDTCATQISLMLGWWRSMAYK